MKKYDLLPPTVWPSGFISYRIQATRSFGDVKEGEIGGYVETDGNLSHYGDCWIYDDARVYGKAHVSGNATIHNEAKIFGSALIRGSACVKGKAQVYERAQIGKSSIIMGEADLRGDCQVYGGDPVSGTPLVIRGFACHYTITDNGYITTQEETRHVDEWETTMPKFLEGRLTSSWWAANGPLVLQMARNY